MTTFNAPRVDARSFAAGQSFITGEVLDINGGLWCD